MGALALIPVIALMADPSNFVPKDARIGDPVISYAHADFYSPFGLMAYDNDAGGIRVSQLNGITGAPGSPSTPDFNFSNSAAPARDPQAGPKFGLSSGAWAVYFTKANGAQPQIWRTTMPANVITPVALTAGDTPRIDPRPTLDNDGQPAWILCTHASQLQNTNTIGWFREDQPGSEQTLNNVVVDASGPRWIAGTHRFTYLTSPSFVTQVAIMDAETGISQIITDDPGDKSDAFVFNAPEWNGEAVLVCTVGQTQINVYRHFGEDEFWTRVLSTPLPLGATSLGYQYMYGFQPFIWNGHTYLCGQIQKDEVVTPYGRTTASVWMVGLDSPFHRLDTGEPAAERYGARVFFGRTKVYVYYNLINAAGLWENHRCDTGLNVGDANNDGRVRLIDIMVVLSQYGMTTLNLAGDINRDGIVDDVDLTAVLANFGLY